jgi:hypothetical protein
VRRRAGKFDAAETGERGNRDGADGRNERQRERVIAAVALGEPGLLPDASRLPS